MNKSKKELYEENKKLKKALKSYSYFWETDALDNTIAELTFIKKKTTVISIVAVIIISFLIGTKL
jgi:hypothetical protein